MTKRIEGTYDLTTLPFKRGDYVTIPKGTVIHTTSPIGEKVAGRTLKVKIAHIYNGYPACGGTPGRNPVVEWVGAGGYWHRVDINDVPEAQ